MNRTSGRSLVIGLCAVALSTVVSPLFLKYSPHRRAEQAWSSHQQGSVTAGLVRAEPLQTPSATPDDEKRARQQALIDELTRTGIGTASRQSKSENDFDSPSDSRRSQVYKADIARSAHITPPVMKKKPAEHMRKKNAEPSINGDTKQSEARVAPAPAALPSEGVQTNPSGAPTPLRQVPAADLPNQTTTRASDPVDLPTENVQVSGGGKTEIPVPSLPKSRKDVQDELRKARSNGSLPRFGNPDPYGPGGSPSTLSE
jgi:hypothetical protein